MKLRLSDLLKLTLTFICIATPTIAQFNYSEPEGYRNPFLPGNHTVEIKPKIPWSKPSIDNPFLPKKITTKKPVTDPIPRRFVTVEEGCGRNFVESVVHIQGGTPSRKHEWPFIAILGYGEGIDTNFKCGGTLITARHVLTAAHCILHDLKFVRLGEHDLSTNTDTLHIDIPIAKVARHPQYNRRNGRSDIAVIYLERNVEFSTKILPICMPSSPKLRSKSYVDTMCTIAGWGKLREDGPTASVLNELQLPILSNEVCRNSYAKINRYITKDQFDEATICAGVLTGGRDSCQGDSGGPLIITENVSKEYPSGRYYLLGVVAYGVGCARPGIPGVYTSTPYFMDWILEKLLETPSTSIP